MYRLIQPCLEGTNVSERCEIRIAVFSYVVQLWGATFFWQPIQCLYPALAADGLVCRGTHRSVGLGHLGADDLQQDGNPEGL